MVRYQIQFKSCESEDAAALCLIGQATFLESFAGILDGEAIMGHCQKAHSEAYYRNCLAFKDHRFWLVQLQPGLASVGYLMVAPPQLPLEDVSATDLEIKRIYLLSKFQGGGVGKRLLDEAIKYARTCSARRLLLGVYAHNTDAIGFYEHMGFTKIGTRQFNVGGKYYDDFIMGLSL
ncbi:GNAT family N-acetyltransferase [Marinicella sp. W31]|uniref:GNAT family N-acetyltransferase n=1 Tax=Marinicella sp. W31 TaxID=3023713 RepID=UPI003757F953